MPDPDDQIFLFGGCEPLEQEPEPEPAPKPPRRDPRLEFATVEQEALFEDAELPEARVLRVAMDVSEIVALFRVSWFTYVEWSAHMGRGRKPESVERAWNRLRVDLLDLDVPHERRISDCLGCAANTAQMRMTRAALAWLEEVFPPQFDEPDEDFSWAQLEILLSDDKEMQ